MRRSIIKRPTRVRPRSWPLYVAPERLKKRVLFIEPSKEAAQDEPEPTLDYDNELVELLCTKRPSTWYATSPSSGAYEDDSLYLELTILRNRYELPKIEFVPSLTKAVMVIATTIRDSEDEEDKPEDPICLLKSTLERFKPIMCRILKLPADDDDDDDDDITPESSARVSQVLDHLLSEDEEYYQRLLFVTPGSDSKSVRTETRLFSGLLHAWYDSLLHQHECLIRSYLWTHPNKTALDRAAPFRMWLEET